LRIEEEIGKKSEMSKLKWVIYLIRFLKENFFL
jgi:hypothetical protein